MLTSLYTHFVRPVLFQQDSETIHDWTLRSLHRVAANATLTDALASLCEAPRLPVKLFGLDFPNPVGLAAGMDKAAVAVPVWEAMGFGFCELGGVTRHAQPGNPQPRMFRAIADEALVNRMGFNNPGADALAETLEDWRASGRWPRHPVGINLGKSKLTPIDEAAADYQYSFQRLRSLADFFVVNVSSPNTPNLRDLQHKDALDEILRALQANNDGQDRKPLLIKIAPDLTFDAIDGILELAQRREIAGIVATNTTLDRPETLDSHARRAYLETGGLSGRPLRARSTDCIRHIHRQTKGRLPVIGVGGVSTAEDAWEKIVAGAGLLQIYSGLVYRGPAVVREIVSGLSTRLQEFGASSLTEVVGSAA